jgi:hypothetical protein
MNCVRATQVTFGSSQCTKGRTQCMATDILEFTNELFFLIEWYASLELTECCAPQIYVFVPLGATGRKCQTL